MKKEFSALENYGVAFFINPNPSWNTLLEVLSTGNIEGECS